jgi:hypothetical protein
MNGSFKTALIAAVVSAFVAAGAAVATTQTFVLGTTNRVDAKSTVINAKADGTVNPVDAPLLTLQNKNATANATPLALLAGAGRPPFTVNSQTRVANLNADKLDGIDSAGFVHGRGTLLSNRIVIATPSDTNPGTTLLAIPGLSYVWADCTVSVGAEVGWTNGASPVDYWRDFFDSHFGGGLTGAGVAMPFAEFIVAATAVDKPGGTLALGVGSDPGARRFAIVHAFALQTTSDAPCSFQVQGTLWTSQ